MRAPVCDKSNPCELPAKNKEKNSSFFLSLSYHVTRHKYSPGLLLLHSQLKETVQNSAGLVVWSQGPDSYLTKFFPGQKPILVQVKLPKGQLHLLQEKTIVIYLYFPISPLSSILSQLVTLSSTMHFPTLTTVR